VPASELLPYILGALGGLGVLAVYHGMNRLRGSQDDRKRHRQGLWLVNGGVLLIAVSLALTITGV
jgi:hypothetical protein